MLPRYLSFHGLSIGDFAMADSLTLIIVVLTSIAPVDAEKHHAEAPSLSKTIDASFCGVAAIDYVFARFGIDRPQGGAYEELKGSPVASMKLLRRTLEQNGLIAASYDAVRHSTRTDSFAESRLKKDSHQLIGLIRINAPDSREILYHYVIVESASNGGFQCFDPATGTEVQCTADPTQPISLIAFMDIYRPNIVKASRKLLLSWRIASGCALGTLILIHLYRKVSQGNKA